MLLLLILLLLHLLLLLFLDLDLCLGESEGFILALEVSDAEISEHGENFVILKDLAKWESVQCAFSVSPDGEELTWFATQEIEPALSDWLSK